TIMMNNERKPVHNISIIKAFTVLYLSSKRRHTRSKRDWSSDVCSSDLAAEAAKRLGVSCGIVDLSLALTPAVGDSVAHILEEIEIGRASCRERVYNIV